jgi:hypothetical protein
MDGIPIAIAMRREHPNPGRERCATSSIQKIFQENLPRKSSKKIFQENLQ